MRSIVVAMCLVSRVAYADLTDDAGAAAKQLLADEVKAINAGDAKAFAATFLEDGMAILPTAADIAVPDQQTIEAAAKHWLATVGKLTVKLETVHVPAQQTIGVGAWFDADLVAGTTHLRATGIVIRSEIMKNGEAVEGPFKMAALHLSEAADDAAVLAAAAAGKLPAPPALTKNALAYLDPASIAKRARNIYENPVACAIGSAPGERALGDKAVARLLAGWKTLKLGASVAVRGRDPDAMWGFEWSVGTVEATFTVKGKQVKVPYRALLIVSVPAAVAADHGAEVELISAHYSVALR